MAKIIRLTEADLARIVRRVIEEQIPPLEESKIINLMKEVYLKYKPYGRTNFNKIKDVDDRVLIIQRYFNSTGQLGKGQKYDSLKENGIYDENTWWQIKNKLAAVDPGWWNKNRY